MQPLNRIACTGYFLYWPSYLFSLENLTSYFLTYNLTCKTSPFKKLTCLLIKALLLWIKICFLFWTKWKADLLCKLVLNVFMASLSCWLWSSFERRTHAWRGDTGEASTHGGLWSWLWYLLEVLATQLAFWSFDRLGIITSFLPSWGDCWGFQIRWL